MIVKYLWRGFYETTDVIMILFKVIVKWLWCHYDSDDSEVIMTLLIVSWVTVMSSHQHQNKRHVTDSVTVNWSGVTVTEPLSIYNISSFTNVFFQ